MKRVLCWAGVIGILLAPTAVGLTLLGIVPDLWAVASLLAMPTACMALYAGATAGTNAGENSPPLMQAFGAASGGC
jgi:hypothetical protein